MKRVLVIGSNSFSGSDFIDLLLREKKYEVIGVSRSPEKTTLFLPYKNKNSSHFTFHQINLNKDFPKLEKLINEFKPEYIVNFAAQSEVAPSWENPDHWFQTNAVAITKLANFLKDNPFLKKYVHISSPEVYGTCEGKVTEEAPLNPSTPYAASKAAGDLSLFTYVKNFNFPMCIVRATNVYGPHQQLFKIIPRSGISILNQQKIPLHGGGRAVKSYIHIRDVSKGELAIMEDGRIGEIYHLSPEHGVAVHNVVKCICHLMSVSIEEAVEVVDERLGQDKAYIIDSTKARRELGWRPEITLEQGLKEVTNWVKDNWKEIKKCPLHYIHKA